MEAFTEILKEGFGGQAKYSKVGVPMGCSWDGDTWRCKEEDKAAVETPRLRMPVMWDLCQGKLQELSKQAKLEAMWTANTKTIVVEPHKLFPENIRMSCVPDAGCEPQDFCAQLDFSLDLVPSFFPCPYIPLLECKCLFYAIIYWIYVTWFWSLLSQLNVCFEPQVKFWTWTLGQC